MEFSPEFVSFTSALAAIIVIDLMLAGDNAIMIALAARNVPKHLQRRVILWGTAGAIGVRVAMTLAVVWLLRIPGLAGAGGLPFHRDALERLKADVRARRGEHGGRIDVGTFKARYDVTRKYAIPLLEYLDRERVTRRAGEARIVI